MKALLIVTAAVEAGAGLVLTIAPSVPVALLLGSTLDAPAGAAIGRVAGAALLSLATACWLARNDDGRAAKGLIAAMSFYNVAVVAILAIARIDSGLSGFAFWPAVLLHATLAVWCVACLRHNRRDTKTC
jgi:hypothetical protein